MYVLIPGLTVNYENDIPRELKYLSSVAFKICIIDNNSIIFL